MSTQAKTFEAKFTTVQSVPETNKLKERLKARYDFKGLPTHRKVMIYAGDAVCVILLAALSAYLVKSYSPKRR